MIGARYICLAMGLDDFYVLCNIIKYDEDKSELQKQINKLLILNEIAAWLKIK